MLEFEKVFEEPGDTQELQQKIDNIETQLQTTNPSNISAEVVRTLKKMTRRIYIGTGADGNANFNGTDAVAGTTRSGTTYTLTSDRNFNNVTVATGVVVVTRQYLLFCKGSMANNGTIYSSGLAWW